jgi:hypothetical protein
MRARVRIDIPALSQGAAAVLEKVRDAIDRNDLPAALGFAIADKQVKAEIDAFNAAVAARYGERTLLGPQARAAQGPALEVAAAGLAPAQRDRLLEAWPIMRAGQRLAAHERTEQAVKERQALEQNRSVARGL